MKLAKKYAEANKLVLEFKKIDKVFKNVELVCTKTDVTKYDFNRFFLPLKFIAKIHNYEITLDKAIDDQTKLKILINKLNEHNPRNTKKVEEKERVLESARKLLDVRKHIIDLFEKGTFRIKVMYSKQRKRKIRRRIRRIRRKQIF